MELTMIEILAFILIGIVALANLLYRRETVSYDKNQKARSLTDDSTPSGVRCTERFCKGEMMIVNPGQKHPELPLMRAYCGRCSWKGWV